jgi:hypothetical protein
LPHLKGERSLDDTKVVFFLEEVVLNTGDTAWMLISTGLVTLMIPGLALFYGGMVRVKSLLNMMMMSFGALLEKISASLLK